MAEWVADNAKLLAMKHRLQKAELAAKDRDFRNIKTVMKARLPVEAIRAELDRLRPEIVGLQEALGRREAEYKLANTTKRRALSAGLQELRDLLGKKVKKEKRLSSDLVGVCAVCFDKEPNQTYILCGSRRVVCAACAAGRVFACV